MRIVHIAGTNGKGTTAAYSAGILKAAGYRVGVYTSPHLVDVRERIAVDGQMIGEADFVRITKRVLSAQTGDRPTMSDVLFVAALLFFKERGCDFAILETGLGGRLDSTAAIEAVPEVTAIPKIGLDHTAILGSTIEAIAAEKAGIIKAGTKVVTGKMADAAEAVIRQRAGELSVPVIPAGEDICRRVEDAYLKQSYLYENVCTAAAVTNELIASEEKWQAAVREAIRTVKTPGRLELLSEQPFLLFDGAHNPQGARALADTLSKWFSDEKFLFVIACFRRPDYEALLASFVPLAACVYPADIMHERNLGAEAIGAYYRGQRTEVADGLLGLVPEPTDGGSGQAVERSEAEATDKGASPAAFRSARDALLAAKRRAIKTGEKIIACGSLHLYAQLAGDI